MRLGHELLEAIDVELVETLNDVGRTELARRYSPVWVEDVADAVVTSANQLLVNGKPIAKTKLSYVFQNYREAMFPWLRAFDNIAYPLKVMGVPKAERSTTASFTASAFFR